jgi:hypothetical protein
MPRAPPSARFVIRRETLWCHAKRVFAAQAFLEACAGTGQTTSRRAHRRLRTADVPRKASDGAASALRRSLDRVFLDETRDHRESKYPLTPQGVLPAK